ncbi:MAG: M20/M25/M40 family metallo-hydrolase, partial [Verrucomicrobiota bacterium]
ITHLDTVFTAEEEARNDFRWRVSGDRIYGPGLNDIKGGTAMIWLVLCALGKFFPTQFRATRWVILANAAEERLAPDFAPLCRSRLGANARAVMVFEAGAAEFGATEFPFVVARKGRAEWSFAVEGRGAHAGGEPAHGVNALVQAAHLIPRIAALQDLGRDLSVNIGAVNGGTVANRVPSQAVIHGECRAFDPALLDETVNRLRTLCDFSASGIPTVRSEADGHTCRATFALGELVSPWPENPATDRLWQLWQSVGDELGMKILREHRGGVSDGNALAGDLPVLEGLGPAGGNSHCSERSADGAKEAEYLKVSSLAPKALLNTLALARLTQVIVL